MQDSEANAAMEREITQNYKAFLKELPGLLDQHRDKCALMRHREIVGIYPTYEHAVQAGSSLYEDDIFSVQEISDVPVDMGYYSDVENIVVGMPPVQPAADVQLAANVRPVLDARRIKEIMMPTVAEEVSRPPRDSS